MKHFVNPITQAKYDIVFEWGKVNKFVVCYRQIENSPSGYQQYRVRIHYKGDNIKFLQCLKMCYLKYSMGWHDKDCYLSIVVKGKNSLSECIADAIQGVIKTDNNYINGFNE
jgi:hypothetical protein